MDRFLTGDDFAVVIENHSGAASFFADYRDQILEIQITIQKKLVMLNRLQNYLKAVHCLVSNLYGFRGKQKEML